MSHKWLNMGKEIVLELPITDGVPASFRILGNALEPETYEILEASSREAILEIAADFSPDTILLSSMTSAMDVYEVYCQLEQNPSTVYIPIIFVTVQSSKEVGA
jgi:putative two-component system response regulator